MRRGGGCAARRSRRIFLAGFAPAWQIAAPRPGLKLASEKILRLVNVKENRPLQGQSSAKIRPVFFRARQVAEVWSRQDRRGPSCSSASPSPPPPPPCSASPSPVWSRPRRPALPNASYAAVGAATSVPYGWVDFCGRRPRNARSASWTRWTSRLTKKTWATLNHINKLANDAIEPITNLEHWGTMVDHWDYPVDGKGDCKVYALYKRKLLDRAGLPAPGAADDGRARSRRRGPCDPDRQDRPRRIRARQSHRRNPPLGRHRLSASSSARRRTTPTSGSTSAASRASRLRRGATGERRLSARPVLRWPLAPRAGTTRTVRRRRERNCR